MEMNIRDTGSQEELELLHQEWYEFSDYFMVQTPLFYPHDYDPWEYINKMSKLIGKNQKKKPFILVRVLFLRKRKLFL